MVEIWKDIPGYEELYQASTYGRIRTHKNKVSRSKRASRRLWKQRILSGRGSQKSGYRVGLWKNGKCKDFLVARLVASTFLDNYLNTSMTVNHKNGNRFDNRIENLEWLTRGDNIRHAFATGLQDANLKKCKLKIGGEIISFSSLASASRFLGRKNGYISNCISNNRTPSFNNGETVEILI